MHGSLHSPQNAPAMWEHAGWINKPFIHIESKNCCMKLFSLLLVLLVQYFIYSQSQKARWWRLYLYTYEATHVPLSRLQELSGRAREGKLKPHEYQGGSFTWVDCDKTAAPGLGLDCCSCSLPETDSLNCCRELMPWDVHCITVNVTGGALSLADVLYMLCCAGSSAVYQTWACLGSRSSLPSSTLLRQPFCLWVAWSLLYSKERTAV